MTDPINPSQLTLDQAAQETISRRLESLNEPPRRASFHELEEQDAAQESRFAVLSWPLMGGVAARDGWLRLVHANRKVTQEDDAQFDTDFELHIDGVLAGYLDIEVKQRWNGGEWPWPWINVAKHPMSHWKRKRFDGRLTNKLVDFQRLPETSFWVGVRRDWNAAVVVRAADLFRLGREHNQQTGYHHDGEQMPPLPVIRVPSSVGFYINDPHGFTSCVSRWFGDSR